MAVVRGETLSLSPNAFVDVYLNRHSLEMSGYFIRRSFFITHQLLLLFLRFDIDVFSVDDIALG